MTSPRPSLRILFLASAHNSLSQRAYVALTERGHEVAVALVDSADAMHSAVLRHRPELIVCPMLKKLIPEAADEGDRADGGSDFFSNGIDLNLIESADDPSAESWRNLHAINDLVREIVETGSRLVISALAGDAAAGGVPFALAADHVVAREDVVLNPYYQHMGGLYGSEYWTYLLPRRVGSAMADRLTGAPFTPVGTRQAVGIGLLDATFGATSASFHTQTRRLAERLARDPRLGARLDGKRRRRALDEQIKPLRAYRTEEMARSYQCFFGPDRSYHEARRRFTHKLGPATQAIPSTGAPAAEALTDAAASAAG